MLKVRGGVETCGSGLLQACAAIGWPHCSLQLWFAAAANTGTDPSGPARNSGKPQRGEAEETWGCGR